jgi:ketol-acid reductoisomerase
MKTLLANIQSGKFAEEWIAENNTGLPEFKKRRNLERSHPIEKVGEELRAMMPFLKPVTAENDGVPLTSVATASASCVSGPDGFSY